MKTYQQALAEGRAGRVEGAAFLAMLCRSFVLLHPGANPELVYHGAMKKGLTPKQLAKLAADDPVGYGHLQFV